MTMSVVTDTFTAIAANTKVDLESILWQCSPADQWFLKADNTYLIKAHTHIHKYTHLAFKYLKITLLRKFCLKILNLTNVCHLNWLPLAAHLCRFFFRDWFVVSQLQNRLTCGCGRIIAVI